MELNPHHPRWYELILGLDEYRQGRYREAVIAIENAGLGAFVWTSAILVAAYGQLGDRAAAEGVLREWPAPRDDFARACRDLADKWFEKGLGDHLLDGLRKAGVIR
jgi:hypothetical protein